MALSDRIRAALGPQARLPDVRTTLAEAKAALPDAKAKMAAAEEILLDPATSSNDLAAARADKDEWRLEAMRLERAIEKLGEAIQRREAEAEAEARARRLEQATHRRDELAKTLKERVPGLFAELVDLIQRIEASDAELQGTGLVSAEAIARGVPGNFYLNSSPVKRLRGLAIPYFGPDDAHFTMWPDQLKSMRERTAIEERQRAQLVANVKVREAREAAARDRWKFYEVRRARPGNKDIEVAHRRGRAAIDSAPITLQMEQPQVDAAIAAGLRVTPVQPAVSHAVTF